MEIINREISKQKSLGEERDVVTLFLLHQIEYSSLCVLMCSVLNRFGDSVAVTQAVASLYRTCSTMKDVACSHLNDGLNALLARFHSMPSTTLAETLYFVKEREWSDGIDDKRGVEALFSLRGFRVSPPLFLRYLRSLLGQFPFEIQTTYACHDQAAPFGKSALRRVGNQGDFHLHSELALAVRHLRLLPVSEAIPPNPPIQRLQLRSLLLLPRHLHHAVPPHRVVTRPTRLRDLWQWVVVSAPSLPEECWAEARGAGQPDGTPGVRDDDTLRRHAARGWNGGGGEGVLRTWRERRDHIAGEADLREW